MTVGWTLNEMSWAADKSNAISIWLNNEEEEDDDKLMEILWLCAHQMRFW